MCICIYVCIREYIYIYIHAYSHFARDLPIIVNVNKLSVNRNMHMGCEYLTCMITWIFRV